MEQLNSDLENLVKKQGNDPEPIVKLSKDYSPIFNVVVHMMEDPNMLVFIEGIKMIEMLACLLKNSIKSSKMKKFVEQLADKYKENKTAVLAALEKAFDSVVENRCMPAV